jgi:hypothetical protein
MALLLFACPKTNRQAPTGIETDVQSLSASWKAILKVNCPHCDEVHEVSVRETYINGALDDAAAQLGSSQTAAIPPPVAIPIVQQQQQQQQQIQLPKKEE